MIQGPGGEISAKFLTKDTRVRLGLMGFDAECPQFVSAYSKKAVPASLECMLAVPKARDKELASRRLAMQKILATEFNELNFPRMDPQNMIGFLQAVSQMFFDAVLYAYKAPYAKSGPNKGSPNECVLCSKRFLKVRRLFRIPRWTLPAGDNIKIEQLHVTTGAYIQHMNFQTRALKCPFHDIILKFLYKYHGNVFLNHQMN